MIFIQQPSHRDGQLYFQCLCTRHMVFRVIHYWFTHRFNFNQITHRQAVHHFCYFIIAPLVNKVASKLNFGDVYLIDCTSSAVPNCIMPQLRAVRQARMYTPSLSPTRPSHTSITFLDYRSLFFSNKALEFKPSKIEYTKLFISFIYFFSEIMSSSTLHFVVFVENWSVATQ